MAVLSKVYKGMNNCINKFSSDRKNYVKTTTNLYVSAIYERVSHSNAFVQSDRKLVNVFVARPSELDADQREDLLSIGRIGKSRMATYIQQ